MKRGKTGFIFIVGNMFGSKTREMMHLLNLEQSMGRKVQAFKTFFDDRYAIDKITTHDGAEFPATAVKSTAELISRIQPDVEVIGIDEVQFFDDEMIEFILENKAKYLIIATALQLDFRGHPFPLRKKEGKEIDSEFHVGHLMPHAIVITRYPQCTHRDGTGICRAEGIYIQRFRPDGSLAPYEEPTVIVGGEDKYKPRCIDHFIEPEKSAFENSWQRKL